MKASMGVMDVAQVNMTKFKLFEKQITTDKIRGYYVMVFPVCNVFPRKKTFRDDYISIHIGWIKWLYHIKIWLNPEEKNANT